MRLSVLIPILILTLSAAIRADEPLVDELAERLLFQDESSGLIAPENIDQTLFESALFVDTRRPEQFAKWTIPGAIHIEWRELLVRRNELPRNRPVILFCNTGALSAQAKFALHVAGFDNVLLMQGGLNNWVESAAYKPVSN